MDRNANIGVALWLSPRPASPLCDALESAINGFRPLFDDGAAFGPHVTITTNIAAPSQRAVDQVLDSAVAAARAVPQLDTVFNGLHYGSHFFKKVYFGVERRAPLLSLAQICREEFVVAPRLTAAKKHYSALSPEEKEDIRRQAAQEAENWAQHDYDPHLSLVYSDVYPIDEAVQRTIDSRLSDMFGDDYATRGLGWTGGRLILVRCEGPVEDWQTLGYRDI